MPNISHSSIKLIRSILILCVVCNLVGIFLEYFSYYNLSNCIGLFACALYIYHYWYFRKFLTVEFNYQKFTTITVLTTLAIAIMMISYLFAIIEGEDSETIQITYLLSLILILINIPYSIKLYRLDAGKYQLALNLIATGGLINLAFSYFSFYYYSTSFYADDPLLIILNTIFSVEDVAFIYLYSLVLKEFESGGYVLPEDRFTIDGFEK